MGHHAHPVENLLFIFPTFHEVLPEYSPVEPSQKVADCHTNLVSTSKTYLLRILLYEIVANIVDSVFSGNRLRYC